MIPKTRLNHGPGLLQDCEVRSPETAGTILRWRRQRLRVVPPTWSTNEHLHLIGRTWEDNGKTFRVKGLEFGNDGLIVVYSQDDGQHREERPALLNSSLQDVLLWLEGKGHEDGSPHAALAVSVMKTTAAMPFSSDGRIH